MHCRNCSSEVIEQAIMCVTCGTPPKSGSKFCQNCGKATESEAIACVNCGVKLAKGDTGEKEWLPTLLLCLFVGAFGVHRFYTGHTAIGVIQLLTLGGCGIWALVDLIFIIVGKFKDSDGNNLVKS